MTPAGDHGPQRASEHGSAGQGNDEVGGAVREPCGVDAGGADAQVAAHVAHHAADELDVVVAAGIVRLTLSERPGVLTHPSLRFAGLISYGTYLLHNPLLESGLRLTGTQAGSGAAPLRIGVVVLGLFVMSALAGAISYVMVERPFLRTGPPPTQPPRPRSTSATAPPP